MSLQNYPIGVILSASIFKLQKLKVNSFLDIGTKYQFPTPKHGNKVSQHHGSFSLQVILSHFLSVSFSTSTTSPPFYDSLIYRLHLPRVKTCFKHHAWKIQIHPLLPRPTSRIERNDPNAPVTSIGVQHNQPISKHQYEWNRKQAIRTRNDCWLKHIF